jgi:hypothetical protein
MMSASWGPAIGACTIGTSILKRSSNLRSGHMRVPSFEMDAHSAEWPPHHKRHGAVPDCGAHMHATLVALAFTVQNGVPAF